MTTRRHYNRHPFEIPRAALDLLGQEKYWVDANLERLRLKDLETDHLRAIMLSLIQRAPTLKLAVELYLEAQGASPEELDAGGAGHSPDKWMQSQPLFLSLRRRWLKRQTEPVQLRPTRKILSMDLSDDPEHQSLVSNFGD